MNHLTVLNSCRFIFCWSINCSVDLSAFSGRFFLASTLFVRQQCLLLPCVTLLRDKTTPLRLWLSLKWHYTVTHAMHQCSQWLDWWSCDYIVECDVQWLMTHLPGTAIWILKGCNAAGSMQLGDQQSRSPSAHHSWSHMISFWWELALTWDADVTHVPV